MRWFCGHRRRGRYGRRGQRGGPTGPARDDPPAVAARARLRRRCARLRDDLDALVPAGVRQHEPRGVGNAMRVLPRAGDRRGAVRPPLGPQLAAAAALRPGGARRRRRRAARAARAPAYDRVYPALYDRLCRSAAHLPRGEGRDGARGDVARARSCSAARFRRSSPPACNGAATSAARARSSTGRICRAACWAPSAAGWCCPSCSAYRPPTRRASRGRLPRAAGALWLDRRSERGRARVRAAPTRSASASARRRAGRRRRLRLRSARVRGVAGPRPRALLRPLDLLVRPRARGGVAVPGGGRGRRGVVARPAAGWLPLLRGALLVEAAPAAGAAVGDSRAARVAIDRAGDRSRRRSRAACSRSAPPVSRPCSRRH